jgi:hypothetical protein
MVAVVSISENTKLNRAVTAALASRFKGESVEILSSLFRPEFASDGLFAKAFSDPSEAIKNLELENYLDVLVLARQEVKYSTNRALENVITASMTLQITAHHVGGNLDSSSWTFIANGAGFKQADARALAEERLIKQISADTKMSLAQ